MEFLRDYTRNKLPTPGLICLFYLPLFKLYGTLELIKMQRELQRQLKEVTEKWQQR